MYSDVDISANYGVERSNAEAVSVIKRIEILRLSVVLITSDSLTCSELP